MMSNRDHAIKFLNYWIAKFKESYAQNDKEAIAKMPEVFQNISQRYYLFMYSNLPQEFFEADPEESFSNLQEKLLTVMQSGGAPQMDEELQQCTQMPDMNEIEKHFEKIEDKIVKHVALSYTEVTLLYQQSVYYQQYPPGSEGYNQVMSMMFEPAYTTINKIRSSL